MTKLCCCYKQFFLLQMCKEETKCHFEDNENSPSLVSSLRKTNPEKFQRYKVGIFAFR